MNKPDTSESKFETHFMPTSRPKLAKELPPFQPYQNNIKFTFGHIFLTKENNTYFG